MKTMRGRSTRRLLPLLAVPLAGFAGLGATQAPSGAQRVAVVCGQTLSSNTTVANDLTNCADGIKIGAAGITVNLNGHTIDGAGLVNSVGIRTRASRTSRSRTAQSPDSTRESGSSSPRRTTGSRTCGSRVPRRRTAQE